MSGRQSPDLGRMGIWAGDLDRYPMAVVRDAATAIEDAGYGTLWFPETSNSAELARSYAAAALPNRRSLLYDLGFDEVEALGDRLVDALVVRGTTSDIGHRVEEHLDAGADHVSLYVLTDTPQVPPIRQWRELAARLLV